MKVKVKPIFLFRPGETLLLFVAAGRSGRWETLSVVSGEMFPVELLFVAGW